VSKYKLAIAVRKDLEMGKGKIAVQVGHASVLASEHARTNSPELWKAWLDEGQFKLVVKVGSESELQALKVKAESLRLATHIVHDKGFTQVAPNTATCIAIGPAASEDVDKVTGALALL
jgi:PTH2 family peptidyl-tRNA hydrolase